MSHPEHFHSTHIFWVEFRGEVVGRSLTRTLLYPGRKHGTVGVNEAGMGQ